MYTIQSGTYGLELKSKLVPGDLGRAPVKLFSDTILSWLPLTVWTKTFGALQHETGTSFTEARMNVLWFPMTLP